MDDDARIEFEREREKILSELPDSVKSMFGQIGFTLAQPDDDEDDAENDVSATDADDVMGRIVPVLIVSPYDVPPKPIRDVYWFDLFSNGKRKKTLSTLPHLIYHYGSTDPDDCYSFMEQDDFIQYDVGVERGYGNVPVKIQQKINAGIQLTEDEEILVRGLQEIQEDFNKQPYERKRGVLFKERHEQPQRTVASPNPTSKNSSKNSSTNAKKATVVKAGKSDSKKNVAAGTPPTSTSKRGKNAK